MCLFFLLSSFLITELLRLERNRTGTVHLKAFYVRRILRIWPLYLGFLAICFCFGQIYPHPFQMSVGRLIAFVLFYGNLYMASHSAFDSPASVLWSISLEEQYYLSWPTFAKLGGDQLLRAISLLLIPVALFWAFSRTSQGAVDQLWVNSLLQFLFFAVGALLAVQLKGRVPDFHSLARVILLCGGLGLWCFAQWYGHLLNREQLTLEHSPLKVTVSYVFVAFGCCSLLVSVLGITKAVFPKFVVYLGRISYGLYVFHWGYLMLLTRGIHIPIRSTRLWICSVDGLALLLTIGTAALSYRYYEQPFLRLKQRFTFVLSRPE